MSTEQILKVLKNERECIKRQGTDKCDRNCGNCDLCLPDDEILEVYDHLIKIVECEAIYIKCDVSDEEKQKLFQALADAGFGLHPDIIEKYGIKIKGDTE